MGKLGENVPLLIDKAVDFMASSQAFREYLKKLPPRNAIPSGIPDESVPLYLQ
ncbi:protein YibT, partial [Enterobacter kobei]|uniref:protein YibT n=4 Tax=cellular organisms TaxID=131567 RepID=UPI0013D716C8